MPAPLLIALPDGLSVSGITMWAVRLATALAMRGRAVGLILHEEPPGATRLNLPLHPDIQLFPSTGPLPRFDVPRLSAGFAADSRANVQPRPQPHHNVPRLSSLCASKESTAVPNVPPLPLLNQIIPACHSAARALASRASSPVIFSPNLHGDCYSAAAAIALTTPDLIRTIAWHHSDIEYNNRILTHFAPIITSFIAVSDCIEHTLRERLPSRAPDIHNIPYGIVTDPPPTTRPPAEQLRLIYTGRIEHEQKRILALIHLADLLSARNIPHTLTIIGDGPAAPEFDHLAASRPTITRHPAAAPAHITQLLDRHDAFILPSRYEGLSIAMLEAMSRGCTPILARTRSGAAQAIEPGYSGELADIDPAADEQQTALALADTIQRHLARTPEARAQMSRAARETIENRFSLERHIDLVESLLNTAAQSPARHWPAHRPCAFTAVPGATSSATIPEEAPARLAALLQKLSGRKVIIHGAGAHTTHLAPILARSPAHILAITDDNRQLHGSALLGWPIIAPTEAAATGATDIIISSHMHQDQIWSRRQIYESQGLRIHKLY